MKVNVSFLILVFFSFSCTQNKSGSLSAHVATLRKAQSGYNYAVVLSDKKAQFSTVFYTTCDDNTLMEKAKAYAQKNGFTSEKIGKITASSEEAEQNKEEAKKNFRDSGLTVGGDNNYMGGCAK